MKTLTKVIFLGFFEVSMLYLITIWIKNEGLKRI